MNCKDGIRSTVTSILIGASTALLVTIACLFWNHGGMPENASTAAAVIQSSSSHTTLPPTKTQGSSGPAAPTQYVGPEAGDRIVNLRHFGRSGDHRYVPELVAALNSSPYPEAKVTALNALGRMGATEALPAVEAFAGNPQDQLIGTMAIAARARMLAEDNARAFTDAPNQAAAKVERFYREIGVSPAQMSAAALLQQQDSRVSYGPQPVEVEAMRQLADMVYNGPYAVYATLLGVTQVDFSHDYPSILKIQLAPLSREQRVAWLVEDLAHKPGLNDKTPFEEQLLADEGLDASHAAAAKLREMDTHPRDYPDTGFAALCQAIGGVGDKAQAPLVDHFASQSHPGHENIGLVAGQVIDGLKAGLHYRLIPWY